MQVIDNIARNRLYRLKDAKVNCLLAPSLVPLLTESGIAPLQKVSLGID